MQRMYLPRPNPKDSFGKVPGTPPQRDAFGIGGSLRGGLKKGRLVMITIRYWQR